MGKELRLKIPFYKQTNRMNCGPTALKMVFEFLSNKEYSLEDLEKKVDSDKSGVTWTLGLAKASAEFGFKVEFYTKTLGINEENFDIEFYKKEMNSINDSKIKIFNLIEECKKLNVKMEEKSLSLDEILSKVGKNCVPIILLNWNKIRGIEGFTGHFVPIVGFDDENVYVHNQGYNQTQEFFKINKDLFEDARKSVGTDEDIVFIHLKV